MEGIISENTLLAFNESMAIGSEKSEKVSIAMKFSFISSPNISIIPEKMNFCLPSNLPLFEFIT